MNNGAEAKSGGGIECGLYAKDTARFLLDVDPISGGNQGLRLRRQTINGSRTFYMEGALDIDCLKTTKSILNGIDLKLSFVQSSNRFRIISASEKHEFKLEIASCDLHICKVQPPPQILLSHQTIMKVRYFYRRRDICQLLLSAGSFSGHFENVFNHELPIFSYMVLVPSRVVQGRFDTNGYDFHHYNLTYLNVSINGKNISRGPFQMNVESSDFIDAYMNIFRSTGKNNLDTGIDNDFSFIHV